MSERSDRQRQEHPIGEGLITALAVGGFLIILGLTIALTPDISNKVSTFFGDLKSISYPLGGSGSTVNFPAPANPAMHDAFYNAVMNFALGIGILQIVILALRLTIRSPLRRIAETVGNLIFWLGAAVLVDVFLIAGTLSGWFQFWSALIIVIGASLIARFLVFLAKK